MRALLRTTTLLTALIAFVLQLSLAGTGVGCRMEPHTRMDGSMPMPGMQMVGTQMAGMQMAGMNADDATRASSADAFSADASAPDTSMPEDEAPCDHGPSSAACQSMASCASAVAVALATQAPTAHSAGVTRVIPAVVRAPASRSTPPELPPPRA